MFDCSTLEPATSVTQPQWLQQCVLPVIRTTASQQAWWIANGLLTAGATVLELTLTTPDVWQVYDALKKHPLVVANGVRIGMGSLKTLQQLEQCLERNVAFTASPGLIPKAYTLAKTAQHCYLGGALTPSELNSVLREGGRLVKLFPVAPLGGVHYFKTMTAPFPELDCIPFGGIAPAQATAYFEAGASCVGLGSQLMPLAQWFLEDNTAAYHQFLLETDLFQPEINQL